MTKVIKTVWMPLPDGSRLTAQFWLPDGAREASLPAFWNAHCHRDRDRARMRSEAAHPFFVKADYAMIRVDQRGASNSEGAMLDEFPDIEARDGAGVIVWITCQNWCDGNVGMFGKSWGNCSSFQVATQCPRAFRSRQPRQS